jgi:hypothetical protein
MKGKSQEKRRTKRAVQSSNEATILKLVLLEYAVVAVVAILFTSLFVAVSYCALSKIIGPIRPLTVNASTLLSDSSGHF